MRRLQARRGLRQLMAASVGLAVFAAVSTATAAPTMPRAGQPAAVGPDPGCVQVEHFSRCPSWARGYDYPGGRIYVGQQKARAMAVSPDGTRVYVTGSIVDDETVTDFGTIAYEADTGTLLWTARHDGPSHWIDRAFSVAVSPDGNRVFVTGAEMTRTEDTQVGDFGTVAYDAATGDELWVARYDGPARGDDQAARVVAGPDGSRLYVTGSSQAASGAKEFATVAYDAATGQEIWDARYADPAAFGATPSGLGVSADGARVFVTGFEILDPGMQTSAYSTVAYDAETGNRMWESRYAGPGGGRDEPTALAVAPDGAQVFVTGRSVGAESDFDYGTVALDARTGDRMWESRYDADRRRDLATALAVTPSGDRVFVTGSSIAAPSDPVEATVDPFRIDAATVAYDASSGAQIWEARFASSAKHAQETARAVGVSPDGSRVFVGGFTLPASHADDPTDPDTFGGCSSSDGFEGTIAGSDKMGSFLTIAYEAATGVQAWYATFNSATDNHSPGIDSGGVSALALSPDGGRVYVAGTFARIYSNSCFGVEQIENYTDYWTVAYVTGGVGV